MLSGHLTLVFERPSLRAHRLPLETFIDNEVHDTAIFLDQSVRELSISPQLRRDSMEEVHSVNACQQSDYPLASHCLPPQIHTNQVSDLLPGQLLVLCIWRPNDATVLVSDVFEKVWTLRGPLVARHIDEPERQWFLVRHNGCASSQIRTLKSSKIQGCARPRQAQLASRHPPTERERRREVTAPWHVSQLLTCLQFQ